VEPSADPAALVGRYDRDLRELEVRRIEPGRSGLLVQCGRDLVVPPLAGLARVAVDEPDEASVGGESADEAEVGPRRVAREPLAAELLSLINL
jgi:hypothetical protein